MLVSFKINNNIKRITTAKELLELTTVSYQKVKQEVRTDKEHYQRKLFIDALEDMGFFYQQFLRHTKSNVKNEESEYVSEKLAVLVGFIEEDLAQSKEALFDQLNSDDEKVLTVVIYLLSSIETDLDVSPCLNQVLAHFSKCDDLHIHCYIDGLTHGKHSRLESGLNLVKELAPPKISEACEIIIKKRKAKLSLYRNP